MNELRSRARTLPFQSVGPLLEFTGAGCEFDRGQSDRERWLLIQAAGITRGGDGREYHVTPRHVIAFSTQPGDGCEPANVGLCLYPATIKVDDDEQHGKTRKVRTGLSGWRWSSFCKTVYAGDPQCGGPINFLKCHIMVIHLLDYARAIGLATDVRDAGEYWEGRDPARLSRCVCGTTPKLAALLARLRGESEQTRLDEIVKYSIFESAAA